MNRPSMIFSAALTLLLAAGAMAQEPAGAALAVGKVQISADTFTVTETSHEAVFTGNVVVVHPSVTVHADKVVAGYGEGGTSDIKHLRGDGQGAVADPRPERHRRAGGVHPGRSVAAADRQCAGDQCRAARSPRPNWW